jgi:hypothetical protein
LPSTSRHRLDTETTISILTSRGLRLVAVATPDNVFILDIEKFAGHDLKAK